ncbi:hypothetical protein BJX65DRAFT_170993 [Aspergillus insuetus]
MLRSDDDDSGMIQWLQGSRILISLLKGYSVLGFGKRRYEAKKNCGLIMEYYVFCFSVGHPVGTRHVCNGSGYSLQVDVCDSLKLRASSSAKILQSVNKQREVLLSWRYMLGYV